MMPSATSDQHARIIERLRVAPATTVDLIEDCDILRPSARIRELRQMGFVIHTHRERVETSKGVHQGVARYVLLNNGQ